MACADSSAERKRLQYAVIKAGNMSRTEAAAKRGVNESIEDLAKELEDAIIHQ